ncbi:arylsulfatase [Telmatocola sphagniphila]|uniref:Arylsulfatase n=1 Tax=Telmatocola sphagniphila TaxID=1123043 RepID=A0A8E6B8B6_9BACT|nr:arylsulfatase [Telmatocola sphagniphila]QVL33748.1 arylsulfatase [Telmatocola sphagniphila]
MKRTLIAGSLILLLVPLSSERVRHYLSAQNPSPPAQSEGSVLPFPPTPSASTPGATLQESVMKWRKEPERLKPGAPSVLIVLIDDVGFGVADTFGGEVHTPTLTRLRDTGISYNTFHTTSICSPTRAALLTGRNHHRVGNGTIAERASDFDGYTGIIPKSSATIPEVLHHYGYKSAAFGKWHNTPANQTTAMGPFDRWPTGHGFDYFYGFLAGETSQWEPRLYENLTAIEPPHNEKYHLTEDMVEKGLNWLKRHQAFSPDKPFLMYWAPGAVHGPHHIFKEWADKYKGKFDDGWDKYRERVFARQKALGWIPADTKLTPRDETLASWDSIPEAERPFQRRLMEVFAGFVEHTDAQVGKMVDGLEQLGLRENTIILYVWGDNGSSAEGQKGTVSELLAQNNIPNTIEQQLAALAKVGGLEALGGPKLDSMYHAGWAWAGGTPFRSTKLVAAHFGGTRNPLVISWPQGIKPDPKPRSQFHHVNDIAPTLYDIIGIKPPEEVGGIKQDPIDGISMAYTFAESNAPGRKKTQYFENNASRGVYHDGWFACTFGPMIPWDTPGSMPRLKNWDANKDVWELYDVSKDFSQADDLSAKEPERLAKMKELFLAQAKANKALPIGGGLWTRFHPEDRIGSPYKTWRFDSTTIRMPEFTAPGLGRESNHVSLDIEVGQEATGVLYALGGISGGLTLYMDKGLLCYEYNMLIIERTKVKSEGKIAAGKHQIEVDETIPKPGGPAEVVLKVDGQEVAKTTVKRTVPGAFTASETLDVGVDLGSPVSLDYAERAPFPFTGKIEKMVVERK